MKSYRYMLGSAIAAIVAASALVAATQKQVAIKGSDTLLILNQAWAEAYGKKGGNIAVSGGGSSIGINAFINGVTDICASSRKIRKSEVDRARGRGAIVNEIPVALDGLAIAVHTSNTVDSIDLDTLRRIYVGQITNWKQVGGPDEPIVVFSRDSNSGTYGFFQENVLKNQNWGKSVRFMNSTSDEAREVGRTQGGIAYGGVAYFRGKRNIKLLDVSTRKGGQAFAPEESNVRARKYPIWRYLYYYTNGKPSGEVKKYIDFCLSSEGQSLVEKVGYYSLR